MARLFVRANSDYLATSSLPVTAAPFTMACWFYSDDLTISPTLMSLADAGVDGHSFSLRQNTSVSIGAMAVFGGSSSAVTSAGASVNTWHHACGVFASGTDRRAFLNGGNKGTDTGSKSPTLLDEFAIGRLGLATPVGYWSGRIAEAAVWDVALGDDEVAILGKGFSPLFVRPQSLVFYAPILGNYSPEIDRVDARNLTVTGAAKAEHPRIFMPSAQTVIPLGAAAGPLYSGTLGDLGFEFGMGALDGSFGVRSRGRRRMNVKIGLGV